MSEPSVLSVLSDLSVPYVQVVLFVLSVLMTMMTKTTMMIITRTSITITRSYAGNKKRYSDELLVVAPGLLLRSGPNGIKNFQSRDIQTEILQNSRIPGFFGTGLALNFIPGFYQKV